jgi:hypothetical protein
MRGVHVSSKAIPVLAILLAVAYGRSYGATRQELQAALATLKTAVDAEVAQDLQVVDVINSLVTKPLSIVVGAVTTPKGTTVTVPILWKAGTIPVSTVQFDIQLPSGITFNSITAGAAATASSKSVQSAPVSGGVRAIIFGLNQNQIPTGVLANLKLDVATTASSGKKALPIIGIVGSDPAGTSVALIGVSGSVTVQ